MRPLLLGVVACERQGGQVEARAKTKGRFGRTASKGKIQAAGRVLGVGKKGGVVVSAAQCLKSCGGKTRTAHPMRKN